MKLTMILVVFNFANCLASANSQKVSLNLNSVKFSEAMNEISMQTKTHFAFSKDFVGMNWKARMFKKNTDIPNTLDKLSNGTNLMNVELKDEITFGFNKSEWEILSTLLQQRKKISGTITDAATGESLPGVTVRVKGTTKGTVTGADGRFSLDLSNANAVLEISFIGYEAQKINAFGISDIKVKLNPEVKKLDEIVVIGYGVQKKSDVTGSLSSLSNEELKAIPVLNPALAIQGRVAGVQVMNNSHQPGGSVSLTIRGTNSINANNEPLYVVDGFQITGDLKYINSNDIVSMEILKDASATAIYGSRGANGVVLITTKQGKSGKMVINFNSTAKISMLSKEIPMLNAHDFRMLMNEATTNQNMLDGGKRTLPYTQDQVNNPQYNTDWQKQATQKAFSHDYNLGISGGNDKTIYSTSLGYKDEEGIIKTSNWKQLSTKVNLESQLNKKVRFGINLNYNNIDNGLVETDNGGNSVPRAMLESFPDIPVYDMNGNWTIGTNEGYASPTALIEGINHKRVTDKFLGNVFTTIELSKGLTLRTTYGRELESSKENSYIHNNLISQALTNSSAYLSNSKIASWQFENYLTYEKSIGEHRFTGLLGATWSKYSSEYFSVNVKTFPTDAFLTNQLQAGKNIVSANSSMEESQLNSYFGRLNYSYKNKYLITGTIRTDGSSKFGVNNKYASFPSLAIGWRLSEEDFIKNLNVFSNLKFRLGYGITGNQGIGNYNSLERLGIINTVLGGQRANGISNVQIANPDLKWEQTGQYNLGLDFGFFNNRLGLVVDFYKKTTNNLLLNAPIPQTTGFSSMLENIGSVENKGVEFNLNSENFNGKFKWHTNLNVSFNKNKVLSLVNNGQDIFPYNFVNDVTIIRVGKPLGSFWGLTREGIYQTKEEISSYLKNPGTTVPGDIKYKDLNNDGVIDSKDRSILGKNNPDFIYGLSNDFGYGAWSLTIQISGVQGMQVANLNPIVLEDRQTLTNSYATLLNRWHGVSTGNNQIAMVRISSQLNISNRHIEDGSYLRFKNIALGYELPQTFTQKLHISSAKLTASLIDWFTITRYGGYDPEVSTAGGHATQGIDFSSYPNAKSFLFGLNINF